MGGGMGGMGGGMFAVPDEASLKAKATSAPTSSQVSADKSLVIHVKAQDGQDRQEAWSEFFSDAPTQTPEDIALLDKQLRATVRYLSVRASKLQDSGSEDAAIDCMMQVREAISAAILAGQVQPWMYPAYALALQATDAPKAEVERALLSSVDFAENPEVVLHIALKLEAMGSSEAALRLCRNVANVDPYRRETYVAGLRIAQDLDDLEGLVWATKGILGQAWPESLDEVVQEARLVARATHARMLEEGKTEAAAKFNQDLQTALSHDVIIRVTWTGDADIDLAVEEPSGTVCSIQSQLSPGGGTLLSDSFSGSGKDQSGAVSETYICPEGFTGQYRLLIRRVWGNVSTGNATVDIITDLGRESERVIRQEVPLTEKDAMVVFEVKEGRRKQEIAAAQLAQLQDAQQGMREQVLGQFFDDPTDSSNEQIMMDLLRDQRRMGLLGPNGFRNRGAVGFRPEIISLPQGAMAAGLAVISGDRRYVRITPLPFFSQIGDVTTFNFVTGDQSTQGGAGGGAGGGFGGGGGGGFGGGGGGGFGN
ncbi:MAG: hypothetical protein ACON5D_19360, partial [Rubripirellula sp.]